MSDQQKVETSPIRVLGLCFLAALLLASYAIRPASSLFGTTWLSFTDVCLDYGRRRGLRRRADHNRFSHNKNLIRVS